MTLEYFDLRDLHVLLNVGVLVCLLKSRQAPVYIVI